MNPARNPVSSEHAQQIAIKALTFLAGDPEHLMRFLSSTGLTPQTLRETVGEPQMLAAVLEHLLGDESQLLVFCASAGIEPDQIGPAHAALAGHNRQ